MATTLLGRTSAGTSADFNVSIAAWKFTAVASGTLAAIKGQTKVANAESTQVEMAIYADDAGGSRPGTRLATATTTTGITGTGVFSVDVSAAAVSIVSGTVYWLAWWGSAHWDFQGDASSSYVEANSGTTMPATWPSAGNGTGTIGAIIWGEDSGAGGGGSPPQLLALMGVGS